MSVCTYCDRNNEAGAQFCSDCGKPLTRAAAVARAAVAVAAAPLAHVEAHGAGASRTRTASWWT